MVLGDMLWDSSGPNGQDLNFVGIFSPAAPDRFAHLCKKSKILSFMEAKSPSVPLHAAT